MKVRQQRGIYVLSELVQGRLREGKKTYAFFLENNGLWELGKMWRVTHGPPRHSHCP